MLKVQPLSSGGQVVGRSAASLGYRNEDQGVEVWAVYRKGSSAGGGIFMEYEIVHTCSLWLKQSFTIAYKNGSLMVFWTEGISVNILLRVFHLERPCLGLKEIAREYNLNWDSSNTEAGSGILNLGFF
ncbi:hypothetical protein Pyn_13566 [Prunus yedoensis var. nudiflora]|uniref:Uncharacterized protein n=1 Tax=Prunus yedoensis var. nudiflora TaxID=2094558 RepID=A0A314UXY7_PRUYE|nr:hypothetical protein Pyn_13566 [Prunus yedoensis var. nudiflora]